MCNSLSSLSDRHNSITINYDYKAYETIYMLINISAEHRYVSAYQIFLDHRYFVQCFRAGEKNIFE